IGVVWTAESLFDFHNLPSEVTQLPLPPSGHAFKLDSLVWTTWTDVRQARRFPEIFQFDPTGGTNNRTVPCVLLCGQDGNNKTFLWATALLGSGELKENFAWVFFAISKIMGNVTKRIR